MLDFITQHPIIALIALIVLADYLYSTIRLVVWGFIWKTRENKQGGEIE